MQHIILDKHNSRHELLHYLHNINNIERLFQYAYRRIGVSAYLRICVYEYMRISVCMCFMRICIYRFVQMPVYTCLPMFLNYTFGRGRGERKMERELELSVYQFNC